jgi:hypothetical protein
VICVVLVVLAVLVVNGVQHVDCVTFPFHLKGFIQSVIRERKRERKRERTRERKRERKEKEREREREREKEEEEEEEEKEEEGRGKRKRKIKRKRHEKRKKRRKKKKDKEKEKRYTVLLLAPGSALEIVNPDNKPAKVNWILSWPCALEMCEKMFFNTDLISDLILLGKAWTLNLAIACGKGLHYFSWLQDQLWKSLLQL